MDQTTDTIRSEIDRRREAMTRDVDEIEDRAREMTDWEHQFRQRPLTMVAVAFGGGMLLGALMGGSSKESGKQQQQRGREQRYPSYYESQGNYGWDQHRTGREDGGGGGGMMSWVTGERGPSSRTEAGKQRAAGKVDEVRGALMALAATKAEEFLREALPGFQSEVEKVRQQSGSSGGDSGQSSQQSAQYEAQSATQQASMQAQSGAEQRSQQ